MKIIAICNPKGGVGKTTTTVNMAIHLQARGLRTLCIDFDPKCNLGIYLDYEPDGKPTIADLVIAHASGAAMPPLDCIIRCSNCGIDYIPASLKLAKADVTMAQVLFRERILAGILRNLPLASYDYILIDCSPGISHSVSVFKFQKTRLWRVF